MPWDFPYPQSCSGRPVVLPGPGNSNSRAHGYTCVLGCAYPHDPIRPPVWYIRWLIQKNLRAGTIVILHDGIPNPTRSLKALPYILAYGHRHGLSFVSIGELLAQSK